MTNRHTMSADERAEETEIRNSLKTSTYLDDVFWESIHQGIKPQTSQVPNYRQSTRSEALGGLVSESGGLHMDFGEVFDSSSEILGPGQTKLAAGDSLSPRESGEKTFESGNTGSGRTTHPSLTISRNMAMAIKKYPALIEFLGREDGTKIAQNISEHLNVHIAESVGANSKEAHDDAVECKVDKRNFKQYFRGKDWVCRVTASGPFRGDELIHYSRDNDVAQVLRKSEEHGQIKYTDISTDFNIIYEAGKAEILPAETEEVTESAEEATVVEEKENVEEKSTIEEGSPVA